MLGSLDTGDPESHLGFVEEAPAHVDAVLGPDDGVGLHLHKAWF